MAREGVTITIGARIQDAMNSLGKVSRAIGGFASKWAALAGVAGAAASTFLALSTAISEAMDMEQALASLETLTGSLDVAQAKMKELVAFAQRSPLDLKGAQDTARLLLATGTSADDLMNRLEMLGEIASGAKQPINELGLVFSQVMNKGKLMAQDLNQFSERGVPLLQELASTYHVTAAEVLKMGENGRISSEMVLYALKKMTSEGGRFYQAMAKQNETFAGKLNALKETWLERLRDFGTPIIQALKPLLVQITQFLTDSKGAFVAAGNAIGAMLTKLSVWITAAFQKWPDFARQAKIFGLEMSLAVFNFIKGVNQGVLGLIKGAISFGNEIISAVKTVVWLAKEWQSLMRSGDINAAINTAIGRFSSALQKANGDIGKNPLIGAMEKFNTVLEGNLKLLSDSIQTLMDAKKPPPSMWGSSGMKRPGEKLGEAPSLLAPGQVFSDKERETLERQARGLGQMSGTAAEARTALRRAERYQQQLEHGNTEEADRAYRLARESQARAADQEARRKTRADADSKNRLEGLREGSSGFKSKAPESRFDPETGRLRDLDQGAGASSKMRPEPKQTEEIGLLSAINKVLEKRLPEGTLA